MKNNTTLNLMPLNRKATIVAVNGEGSLRRRLLDLGLTPGTGVMVRKTAPLGDPIEITVRGYELTLRKNEANSIVVTEESK